MGTNGGADLEGVDSGGLGDSVDCTGSGRCEATSDTCP